MAEPISRSGLWKIQQDYYRSLGPAAWDDKTPYFVTNSQVMAEAYADLVIAFLLDQPPVLEEPVYLLELGSGTGRLAYQMRRELRRKQAIFPVLREVRFVSVLSDIVEANVSGWEKHPGFAGEGFDFALVEPGREDEIRLRRGGQALAGLVNPLVVVANYVFDSMPHDEFFLDQGRVEECRIEIRPKAVRFHSGEERLDIRDVEVERTYVAVDWERYYSGRAQAVLNFYRNSVPHGSVTVPVAALECLDRLRRLGKLVLLSSDRAFTTYEAMAVYPNHPMALHEGCFSHMVNYHALGFGFATRLATSRCMLDGVQTVCYTEFPCGPQLEYAFRERLQRGGAINASNELFALFRDQPPFKAMLGFVQLNRFDPNALSAVAKRLGENLGQLNFSEHHEVRQMLEQVWENDFYFKGSPNVTFWLAHLYASLGYFEKALEFFDSTIERQGVDAMLLYLKGSCHQALGQSEPARRFYEQALELQPELNDARQALATLGTEISR